MPLLDAIAGRHAGVPLLGAIGGVPLLGAMQGCCWVPLVGGIAGGGVAGMCHCGVPWVDAIAGCHCYQLWRFTLGAIPGRHC